MKRRQFLSGLGAAGMGALAGSAALVGLTRKSRAASMVWGEYPGYASDAALPVGKRAKRVLEVFLYGGLSQWETFYVVDKPEYGQAEGHMWWTYLDEIQTRTGTCFPSMSAPLLTDFRVDENGAMVKLGPFTLPLRNRQDIVDRLRLHVVSHTLEPHEGAIPLAMSGYRLGAPKLAGIGAAVQHYYLEHEAFTGEPYAYVLYSPGDFPTDNLRAASAVGMHPGSSRPLSIKVTASTAFIDALSRQQVGNLRPQFDGLLDHYAKDFKARLTPNGKDTVRSAALSDYQFALATMKNTDQLASILDESFFKGVGGSSCGESANPNYPHMGLRLAAHLLTRPDSKARHVTVVDGGLIPANGGGSFDTHANHIKELSRNLNNVLTQLVAIINEPGEDDPNKINLDDTLVVLNTEFGRTPWKQGSTGRNHHPYAYVTAMFGGPIGPDQQGIVGGIGPTGYATSALSPAETRAATLAALGIYPFAPECYAVSDVSAAANESEGAIWLKEEVLGVKS